MCGSWTLKCKPLVNPLWTLLGVYKYVRRMIDAFFRSLIETNISQKLIARRAGIEAVEWDGYLKYWKPSERFIQVQPCCVLLLTCHCKL